jgi:toxin ParE1/3/4
VAVILKRPRALFDLAEIWSYIAEDSVRHADAFASRIDKTFRLLARRPGIGRTRRELYLDLRSFVVGKYVVFYLPLKNGIDVIRVLHGARDIEATFEYEEQ